MRTDPRPAPPTRGSASPPRLWFADNLRILLTSLVVLHHIAVMYSGLPLWYYVEPPTGAAAGAVLAIFVVVNQAWFMGAFFLLSGYFTPGSFDRKGPGAFLRDRLVRLGIPLVVFYFVLSPLLHAGSFPGGSPLETYLDTIGTGPLWFVLALLVFDVCYAAFRVAVARRAPRERAARPPAFPMVLAFVAVLALATYALRIVLPSGTWVPGIDFPSSAYLPQYAAFFVAGAVAYRRGWFLTVTPRMGWAGFGLAAGASLVFLPLALAGGLEAWMGHGTLSSLFFALWDSAFAVGAVIALLAFFRRRLDGQGPLGRYLSAHAFTVYVIHAFVVTAAGLALGALAWPTPAKFALVAAVALPACFALAGPIRRLPGVRRVL
ncbi:fucose 4-O-acetylase-like acetyltransferase [Nonomuraea thailandensis]|uniref:Fucose 4-O-acetylase-like acetyltransferase n=1 Tax=Nonomuraea thailandensis TaxID=1188745 RepID=A0A9X2GL33_9ACTN|nr:acyltransferase family protein [Nonomuraea thailandensis]MCP2357511.1 fucose 4-O-acetylase-like acetyltransferase [Nonomuraea thailandensis]